MGPVRAHHHYEHAHAFAADPTKVSALRKDLDAKPGTPYFHSLDSFPLGCALGVSSSVQ